MTEPLRTMLSSSAKAGDPVRRGFSVLSLASLEYWVARSCRATTLNMWPHSRDALRPSFAKNFPPSNQRAQGRPGARCTRGLACGLCKTRCTRAYRAAENTQPSLRNGFTAYGVLSPVGRARCHRCPSEALGFFRAWTPAYGASGPHAFAVRSSCTRQAQPLRPSHPRPTFVTIASAPLSGRDGHRCELICGQ